MFQFDHWQFNNEVLYENPLRINISKDSELIAVYKEVSELSEISKTATITSTTTTTSTSTLEVKWILAATVPATPAGYERLEGFDISLGELGTLWAFKKL
jgi:thiamine biosynthesis lipoprotein ApbE